eukprot:10817490-Ditylum_brightwellii.AAC.1
MQFGKPGVEHFEACVAKLGLDKNGVAHVDDSLHHDTFVTSGIHKKELGSEFGEMPGLEILEGLMEEEVGDVRPTH